MVYFIVVPLLINLTKLCEFSPKTNHFHMKLFISLYFKSKVSEYCFFFVHSSAMLSSDFFHHHIECLQFRSLFSYLLDSRTVQVIFLVDLTENALSEIIPPKRG